MHELEHNLLPNLTRTTWIGWMDECNKSNRLRYLQWKHVELELND